MAACLGAASRRLAAPTLPTDADQAAFMTPNHKPLDVLEGGGTLSSESLAHKAAVSVEACCWPWEGWAPGHIEAASRCFRQCFFSSR